MRRYLLSLFFLANITVLVMPTFAQFPIWSPFGENRILMNLAYYPGANSTYESTTTDGDFKCSDTKGACVSGSGSNLKSTDTGNTRQYEWTCTSDDDSTYTITCIKNVDLCGEEEMEEGDECCNEEILEDDEFCCDQEKASNQDALDGSMGN